MAGAGSGNTLTAAAAPPPPDDGHAPAGPTPTCQHATSPEPDPLGCLGPRRNTNSAAAAAGDPIVYAFGLPALVAPAPGPLRLKLNKTRAPCLARSKKAQGSAAAHDRIRGTLLCCSRPRAAGQARPHHRAWCVMPRSSPPRHFTSSVHADVECSRACPLPPTRRAAPPPQHRPPV